MKLYFLLLMMLPALLVASAQAAPLIVLDEDFSRMPLGTALTPWSHEIEYDGAYGIPSTLTAQPGWTGGGVHEAGGSCALMAYHDSYGHQLNGFISTPPMRLGGTAVLTFRARRLPGHDSSLWVSLCDDFNGPGEDQYTFTLSNQWVTYSFTASRGSVYEKSYFQLASRGGNVVIDDVMIQYTRDRLGEPWVENAVNHAPGSFTAVWEDVEAPEYLFNLYRKDAPETIETGTFSEGFDDPGGLEDWTIEAPWCSEAGRYGQGAPSLQFDAEGQRVVTPAMPLPVNSISFWIRPSDMAVESDFYTLLRVCVHHTDTDQWEPLANIPNFWCLPEGSFYTFNADQIGSAVDRVEISLIQKGTVTFWVDDLTLGYGTQETKTYLYKDHKVEGTSFDVTGLDPEANHYFYVLASDGDLRSPRSNEVWVDGLVGVAPAAPVITMNGQDAFSTTWAPMPHAQEYTVNLYRQIESLHQTLRGCVLISDDFSGGAEGTQWQAVNGTWRPGRLGSLGTSPYGQAGIVYSPMLDLSGGEAIDVDATVITTVGKVNDGYGLMVDEGVFVMVLKSPEDTRALASGFIAGDGAAGTFSGRVHIDLPAGLDLSQAIVAFMSMSGKEFYVDEVTVRQDVGPGVKILEPVGVPMVTTGNAADFWGLATDVNHAVTVKASARHMFETFTTEPSAPGVAHTNLSISDNENEQDVIHQPKYDLQGRPAGHETRGVTVTFGGKMIN